MSMNTYKGTNVKLRITKEDREGLKRVFKKFDRKKSREEIFYNLVFCICAPQTKFKNNIEVINKLKKLEFYSFPYEKISSSFREWYPIFKPVRFYKNKTKYVLEAKKKFNKIMHHIRIYLKNKKDERHSYAMREYLVDEVKGLGMKAVSHFLRNLGDTNLAILDTHVIKFLNEYYPNDLNIKNIKSKRHYEQIEGWFQKAAGEYDLTSAELDAIIWKNYSGTDWKDFKY